MADTADLDALVTRNIGDIEAALNHAHQLGHSLIEQIEAILVEDLGAEWHVESDVDDDSPLWMSKQSWFDEGKPTRKNSYRLQFDQEEGPGGDDEWTWFSTMLGAGPNGARIRVYFWSSSFSTNKRWSKIMAGHDDQLARLVGAGFETDATDRLYIPFALDAEVLAKAYETGNLDDAMQPAHDLVRTIKASADDLSALIERDRNLD